MTGEQITALVALLLGGGAVATYRALFGGIASLRQGARAKEREAIQDLARWRDEADEARRTAETDRDYWQRVSAGYAGQLLRAGIEPVPPEPVPPSERAKARR